MANGIKKLALTVGGAKSARRTWEAAATRGSLASL